MMFTSLRCNHYLWQGKMLHLLDMTLFMITLLVVGTFLV